MGQHRTRAREPQRLNGDAELTQTPQRPAHTQPKPGPQTKTRPTGQPTERSARYAEVVLHLRAGKAACSPAHSPPSLLYAVSHTVCRLAYTHRLVRTSLGHLGQARHQARPSWPSQVEPPGHSVPAAHPTRGSVAHPAPHYQVPKIAEHPSARRSATFSSKYSSTCEIMKKK